MKGICLEISDCYEINFLEIGYENDHVHFLAQSIPNNTVLEIIVKLKSLTAFLYPEIKKQLWEEVSEQIGRLT